MGIPVKSNDLQALKRIIEVYKALQGTGNTRYQNAFYYKQLKKFKETKQL